MMRSSLTLLSFILLFGCGGQPSPSPDGSDARPDQKMTLPEARRGFQTKLVRQVAQKEPVPQPPAKLFRIVRYESPAGKMAAYLSQPLGDGKKHPAIVWIFGGFGNDIGEAAWVDQKRDNDQSASAFRKEGIVMMYPSLRGGNDNPGFQESFYGEVDDVLAAVDFLAKQDYVDPKRIYLGGHSTGGTLALLVAESTDRFRGVFSFGPVSDVVGYGPDELMFDLNNAKERQLRAPGNWLHAIRNPTFVFEGTLQGNLIELQKLSTFSKNPAIRFYPVKGATHFSILAPVTEIVARKIKSDDGPTSNLAFTEAELSDLFKK
jgi:acetyl esterase/lipase